ncbi:DUF5309 domain-containing protein [archaeon]|nr:DUF5309 domain-containing protein [archaeon]
MANSNIINVLGLSHTGHLGTSTESGGSGIPVGAVPINEFRRSFNLGSMRIAELKPAKDPFFTIASKFRSEPTDDPEFKRLEKREIWHRRYAFAISNVVKENNYNSLRLLDVDGAGVDAQQLALAVVTVDADFVPTSGGTSKDVTVNSYLNLFLTTDYDVEKGNITPTRKNYAGTNEANAYLTAAAGKPNFFFVNQTVQIPVSYVKGSDQIVSDLGYLNCIIKRVAYDGNYAEVTFKVLSMKPSWAAGLTSTTEDTSYFLTYGLGSPGVIYSSTTDNVFIDARSLAVSITSSTIRKEDRITIIGSAFSEGSGLPDTSYSDKYSDNYGYTQIFKSDLSMSGTARATVLKLRPNEFAHNWEKTMLLHKKDISKAGFWSVRSKQETGTTKNTSGSNIYRTTEGLVDYVMNNGWVFQLNSTDGYDNFLDQFSEIMNPEIGNDETNLLIHVNTNVFNWFSRLGSGNFFQNTFAGANIPFRSEISVIGRKTISGLNITELSTPHGTMRMIRDINLDGTYVKMIAVNYSNVSYRPLKGNGFNRDTSVYMGVQSLENTGVDAQTDLVQTEAGFDFRLGETFAMWI